MSAIRSVLLLVIGAAVGTILSDLFDLGWVAPVVVLIVAGAGLAYVEMKPTARQTDLLRIVSDARLAGRKVRGRAPGAVSASSGDYHRLREEIITWTKETYGSLVEVDKVAAERFGNPTEAESLDAHEHVTTGNIGTKNLIAFLDDRLGRLDKLRDS
jgi:hypothetical protein